MTPDDLMAMFHDVLMEMMGGLPLQVCASMSLPPLPLLPSY